MSRRSTPERIDQARSAATRNRLIGERVTEETADAWIAAWEAKAAEDGLERGSAYWDAGWKWIAAQRERRTRPRPDRLWPEVGQSRAYHVGRGGKRMTGMNASIEIERPVEVVYGFFVDLEHSVMRTDPMVEAVEKTTDGPLAAGTSYRMRQRVMGRVQDQDLHVTAVDPNHRIDMEASFGPVRPQFHLTFEPTTTGTRVTFRGDSRPKGPLSLVTPLMDRVGERNWRRRLGLMKETLEGEPVG